MNLFHYLFFQGISLVLLIGSHSSAFSLYLNFSVSMNLGELSPVVLKGCFYMRAFLYRLCESNIFGVRTVFGIDASHIFPQSVLIPLIVGVVVSRVCTGCEVGLPLCSLVVTALFGVGSAPQLL